MPGDEAHGDPGEYRRRDGVRLAGRTLVSTRPLSATRVNDAARDVLAALGTDAFRSPQSVADETDRDAGAVARLFERLHRRGFLAWRPGRDPAHRPPVSVVVTVRDDREHLRACLDALAALDYPTYEVVVVDDGSTDGTADVAATHRLADQGRVRTVPVGSPEEPLGIGASRNRGVEAARYDVVAFTDADCHPRPGWLADLVPRLAAHDLVGGRVRPAGDAAASAYEAVNSSLDMGPRAARVDPDGATPYLPTANLVGRRRVFEAVGFPERDVAEDVEVCWRALDAGFDVVYTPDGVVEHAYRRGLGRFARRRAAYGASEALLARDHGRDDAPAVDVSPAAVAVAALAGVGLGAGGRASSLAFLGAAFVAVATLAGYGVALWRRHRTVPSGVTAGDLFRSWLRERASGAYVVCRELTRYYALPLALVGALVGLVGATELGLAVLVGVTAVAAVPLLVEYRVHAPDCAPWQYAAYYLADHLGYQRGVYRGALAHRTLDHVHPGRRFRWSVPANPLSRPAAGR